MLLEKYHSDHYDFEQMYKENRFETIGHKVIHLYYHQSHKYQAQPFGIQTFDY